ncbi:hydroxymethylglutaryl-CoA lyase [Elioraea rosea]|uniref:hydroxymethylglutaryl-CoA lyase n=1 Tax=Elioraea rosea TaxID=2492390 RepID=UPI0011870CEC|nr:hydroxymethylglutaryl-CoA lyase [Elioraea rosea]
MSGTVTIVEVAPRDGLQAVSAFVPTEQKIALVRALAAAGLVEIEATSFVSPKAIPQLADAAEVLAAANAIEGILPSVLVPNRKGVERALAAGARKLGLVMSATEGHNRSNLNRSVEESFNDLADIVATMPADGPAIRWSFSCSFHCPFEGVVAPAQVLALLERAVAIRPGLTFALADTTGNAAPDQVRALFAEAIARFGSRARFAFHGHDTYNLGIANVAAAYEAGVREIDAAAGGIGGCPFAPGASGNVATEDVVWLFRRLGVETGARWRELLEAADLAARLAGGGAASGHLRHVRAAREAA